MRSPVKRVALAACFCFLFLAGPASADEPLPVPRLLPAPLVAPPVYHPYPIYHRTSQYDVWQSYAVDRQGFFRLRVVYSPYGSYYHYNGQPYPWVTTHPREWMPYVVD